MWLPWEALKHIKPATDAKQREKERQKNKKTWLKQPIPTLAVNNRSSRVMKLMMAETECKMSKYLKQLIKENNQSFWNVQNILPQ